MNKILLGALGAAVLALNSMPAAAADLPARMPVKAPAPVVVAAFNWTGCYIGAHGGYAWGDKDWTWNAFPAANGGHDVDGWLVGGQVGCNIQYDRVVFGIEGQFSWTDLKGSHSFNLNLPFVGGTNTFGFHTKVDFLGTVAARLGYSFDRTLLFVKGGGAFAHDKYRITVNGANLLTGDDDMRWGWMVGAGVEYAFTGNWSMKIEYNYLDFGKRDTSFCGAGCETIKIDQQIQLVKAGINYRFGGGGPVVARY
jgi:outer membrane immunogenic protein